MNRRAPRTLITSTPGGLMDRSRSYARSSPLTSRTKFASVLNTSMAFFTTGSWRLFASLPPSERSLASATIAIVTPGMARRDSMAWTRWIPVPTSPTLYAPLGGGGGMGALYAGGPRLVDIVKHSRMPP